MKVEIIESFTGVFGDKIEVAQNFDGTKSVYCNGFVHSSIRKGNQPSEIEAINFMYELVRATESKEVLILGMGAGDLLRRLKYNPNGLKSVAALEIEPAMIEIAIKYNGVPEDVILNHDVFNFPECDFEQDKEKAELIIHDVFTLDLSRKSEYIDRFTMEYWDKVRSWLRHNGILCINTIPSEGEHENSLRILKTMFTYVQTVYVGPDGNQMSIFSNSDILGINVKALAERASNISISNELF